VVAFAEVYLGGVVAISRQSSPLPPPENDDFCHWRMGSMGAAFHRFRAMRRTRARKRPG